MGLGAWAAFGEMHAMRVCGQAVYSIVIACEWFRALRAPAKISAGLRDQVPERNGFSALPSMMTPIYDFTMGPRWACWPLKVHNQLVKPLVYIQAQCAPAGKYNRH